ncbi:hypothetical protein V8E36_009042 [Tilletia maclaganii]
MLPSSARIQLYTLLPLLSSPSTTNSSSSLHPFCAFARSFASCSVRACCVVSEMFSLSMTARRVDPGSSPAPTHRTARRSTIRRPRSLCTGHCVTIHSTIPRYGAQAIE